MLYEESLNYKDTHRFPPSAPSDAAFYHLNIGHINQEVATVHLASGILGRFISKIGRACIEKQLQHFGLNIDSSTIDDLINASNKPLMQLLSDEGLKMSDIAPSSFPPDIPVTPAQFNTPLPSQKQSTLLPASSPSAILYIDIPLAQPQPSCPISTLNFGNSVPDPLRTPTKMKRLKSSPPVQSSLPDVKMAMASIPPLLFKPTGLENKVTQAVSDAQALFNSLQLETLAAELLLKEKQAAMQKVVKLLAFETQKASAEK